MIISKGMETYDAVNNNNVGLPMDAVEHSDRFEYVANVLNGSR